MHEVLQTRPFLTTAKAMEHTHLTKPTVNAVFDQLLKLGIVEEITKKKRGRVYAYRAYLTILNEGGEPLDATGTIGAATIADPRSEGKKRKTFRAPKPPNKRTKLF